MSYLNHTPNEKDVFHTCNMLHPVGLGSSTIHNGPAGSELVNDSQLCNHKRIILWGYMGYKTSTWKAKTAKYKLSTNKYYLFQRVIKWNGLP